MDIPNHIRRSYQSICGPDRVENFDAAHPQFAAHPAIQD
jgi:hypothetical protein